MADFLSLSLFELDILGALQTHNSLRSIASFRNLQAPHLSKIIGRIEEKMGLTLVLRSPQGYILTPDGIRYSRIASNVFTAAQDLNGAENLKQNRRPKLISIATIRFIASLLIAPSLENWRAEQSNLRFRLIEMSPDELLTSGIQACDIVLTTSAPNLTKAWDVEEVGTLEWGLFCSKFHPLINSVGGEEVKQYPFLVPTYWHATGYEAGNDFCPIPWSQRIKGDEISSVSIGMDIIRSSPNQLIYAPRLTAQGFLDRGEMRELKVKGWKISEKTIYMAVRADKINVNFKRDLLKELRKNLSR